MCQRQGSTPGRTLGHQVRGTAEHYNVQAEARPHEGGGTARGQTAANTPAPRALRLSQHLGLGRCSKPIRSRDPSSERRTRAEGSMFSVAIPARKRLLEHSVMAVTVCAGEGGGEGRSGTELLSKRRISTTALGARGGFPRHLRRGVSDSAGPGGSHALPGLGGRQSGTAPPPPLPGTRGARCGASPSAPSG